MRKTPFLILSLALLSLVAFGAAAAAPTVAPPAEDGIIEAPAPQEGPGEALEPLFGEANQPRQVSSCAQCDTDYENCYNACTFPNYGPCVKQCEDNWLYCTSTCS